MSNTTIETAKQIHRDQMNAGFWAAVKAAQKAFKGLGIPDDAVRLSLVGESDYSQHRIEVPIVHLADKETES